MAGFIDGDLVEKFLDLPRPQMEDIVRGIKVHVCEGYGWDDEFKFYNKPV